jgi:hypothetical protein
MTAMLLQRRSDVLLLLPALSLLLADHKLLDTLIRIYPKWLVRAWRRIATKRSIMYAMVYCGKVTYPLEAKQFCCRQKVILNAQASQGTSVVDEHHARITIG